MFNLYTKFSCYRVEVKVDPQVFFLSWSSKDCLIININIIYRKNPSSGNKLDYWAFTAKWNVDVQYPAY